MTTTTKHAIDLQVGNNKFYFYFFNENDNLLLLKKKGQIKNLFKNLVVLAIQKSGKKFDKIERIDFRGDHLLINGKLLFFKGARKAFRDFKTILDDETDVDYTVKKDDIIPKNYNIDDNQLQDVLKDKVKVEGANWLAAHFNQKYTGSAFTLFKNLESFTEEALKKQLEDNTSILSFDKKFKGRVQLILQAPSGNIVILLDYKTKKMFLIEYTQHDIGKICDDINRERENKEIDGIRKALEIFYLKGFKSFFLYTSDEDTYSDGPLCDLSCELLLLFKLSMINRDEMTQEEFEKIVEQQDEKRENRASEMREEILNILKN